MATPSEETGARDAAALSAMAGQLEDLALACRELGSDELSVLLLIARRLAMGRKCYGPLDIRGDRRDWQSEATEELLDACVYLGAESLRRT